MDAFNPFSSRDAAVQKLWEQWQPRSAKSDKDKPIALADFDPGAKPFSNGNGKTEDKAAVEALGRRDRRAAEPAVRRPPLQAAGRAAGH